MTSDHHDEHGEILRRALHAEAEKIVPSPDGLERIRAGIDSRRQRRFGPFSTGWLTDRFTGTWSRPLLAAAAALLIVALGVSAPQTIDRITAAVAGNSGPSGEDGQVAANGNAPGQSGQPGGPGSSSGPGQGPGGALSGSPSPSPTDPAGGAGCSGQGEDPSTVAATETPAPGQEGVVAPTCPPGSGGDGGGDEGGGSTEEPGGGDPTTPAPEITPPPQTPEPPPNSTPPAQENPEPDPS
jgi:hypothetical protein